MCAANGWVARACARARVAAPLAGPQAGITCQQHDLANWWGTCPPSVCGLRCGEGPGPVQGWAAPGASLGLSEPFLWWPCWLFFRIGNAACPSQDPIRKPRIKVRVSEGLRGERSTLGVKTFPGNKSLPLPLPSAKELERHGGGGGGSVGGARQSGFPGDLI